MTPQKKMIDEIQAALGAHGAWKLKLKTAVATRAHGLDPAKVGCDHSCAFGTWLHGASIDATTKAQVPYQTVRRLHADFHRVAGTVAKLAAEGRDKEAEALLNSDYMQRSDKLARALTLWKRELGG